MAAHRSTSSTAPGPVSRIGGAAPAAATKPWPWAGADPYRRCLNLRVWELFSWAKTSPALPYSARKSPPACDSEEMATATVRPGQAPSSQEQRERSSPAVEVYVYGVAAGRECGCEHGAAGSAVSAQQWQLEPAGADGISATPSHGLPPR